MSTPRIFWTADWHLGHTNRLGTGIIDFCNRPFRDSYGYPDIKAMNRVLIENSNALVGPEDILVMGGDYAFGSLASIAEYTQALTGRKFLARGNHDHHSNTAYKRCGFERVAKSFKLGRIWVTHHPIGKLDTPPEGCEVVLCGHVHERWVTRGRCINIGVDVRGYKPVTLADLGLDESLLDGWE